MALELLSLMFLGVAEHWEGSPECLYLLLTHGFRMAFPPVVSIIDLFAGVVRYNGWYSRSQILRDVLRVAGVLDSSMCGMSSPY